MNWFLWFLVGWFLLGAVLTVATIGRPKTPTVPKVAAGIVVIYALLIAGVLVFGAQR